MLTETEEAGSQIILPHPLRDSLLSMQVYVSLIKLIILFCPQYQYTDYGVFEWTSR